MRKGWHRVLELLLGIPLLLFGGSLIGADISAYLWVQDDPEHRRQMFFFATPLGILPFLIGFWLVSMSVLRMVRQK